MSSNNNQFLLLKKQVNVIEFFSGIGGLGIALRHAIRDLTENTEFRHEKNIDYDVIINTVAAYDVNTNASLVYKKNFECSPRLKSIERLSLNELDIMKADVWLLSPPCQPYTKGGACRDSRDHRAAALHHLINLLSKVNFPPRMVFLENVVGFYKSDSCAALKDTLLRHNYKLLEFVLSPTQIGIPNTRVRYYLAAVKKKTMISSSLPSSGNNNNTITSSSSSLQQQDNALSLSFIDELLQHKVIISPPENILNIIWKGDPPKIMSPTKAFLDDESDLDSSLYLPSNIFSGFKTFRFDIVNLNSVASSTFTKSYGKLIGKSGPIIEVTQEVEEEKNTNQACLCNNTNSCGTIIYLKSSTTQNSNIPIDTITNHHLIETSRLDPTRLRCVTEYDQAKFRWFSDKEALRLHGFPEHFTFPSELGRLQRYALIGNSVNVKVVTVALCTSLMDFWDTLLN